MIFAGHARVQEGKNLEKKYQIVALEEKSREKAAHQRGTGGGRKTYASPLGSKEFGLFYKNNSRSTSINRKENA